MKQTDGPVSVLFVCLGNICRSPLAEGVFRQAVRNHGCTNRFHIDSAGTGGWHSGSPPDPRSVAVARRHGIDISDQLCRKITADDFSQFDYILGMDHDNIANLRAAAPGNHGHIHLFLDLAFGRPVEIADPYYGGSGGFEEAYRIIREGSEALLEKL